jgi:hypothetical protein
MSNQQLSMQEIVAILDERVMTLIDLVGLPAFQARMKERETEGIAKRKAKIQANIAKIQANIAKTREALELDQLAGKVRVGETVHARSWMFGTDQDGQPTLLRGVSATPFYGMKVGDTGEMAAEGETKTTITITEILEEVERLTSSGVVSILSAPKLSQARKNGRKNRSRR